MTWKSTGPLSYQGTQRKAQAEHAPVLSLLVTSLDNDTLSSSGRVALLHPDDFDTFNEHLKGAPAFLQLASGSDTLAAVMAGPAVARGSVQMEAVQRHNMHLMKGERYSFSVWEGPDDPEQLDLVDVEAEVMLFPQQQPDASDAGDEASDAPDLAEVEELSDCMDRLACEASCTDRVKVDATKLARALLKAHTMRTLTVNQLVTLPVDDHVFVLRVCATNTLDAESRRETIGYHCFRGRLSPETVLYLRGSELPWANGRGSKVEVLNARAPPPDGALCNCVRVTTEDGECFPVKRSVLRPCIALTAAVRASHDPADAAVPIDTLTFDRVLIFLEALALGRPAPNFGAHLLDALLAAGRALGCQSLVTFCEDKLGRLESRIAVRSWAEVTAANARGACWLVIDGMVLDVTDWLSEHPGGSSIIPAQALDLDCGRFFEVYHASRESFLYLKEFYIGEVREADREAVPCPEAPSEEFLSQLRSYAWRIDARDVRAYKSF